MNRERRFLELLGDMEFKNVYDEVAPAEFLEIGRYNLQQFCKLELRGECHMERIEDLVSLILAEKLLPMCLDRFGDTGDSSLRRLLEESICYDEMEPEWQKYESMAMEGLAGEGFNPEQLAVIQHLLQSVPYGITDYMVEQVGRLRVVPMREASYISSLLAQMMREGGHDDNTGNN